MDVSIFHLKSLLTLSALQEINHNLLSEDKYLIAMLSVHAHDSSNRCQVVITTSCGFVEVSSRPDPAPGCDPA